MKEMHRLIVTSETYKLASEVDPEPVQRPTIAVDPENDCLWHFRLRRLEAEPIWDSIFTAAGNLDLSVGGPSFDIRPPTARGGPCRSTDPRSQPPRRLHGPRLCDQPRRRAQLPPGLRRR